MSMNTLPDSINPQLILNGDASHLHDLLAGSMAGAGACDDNINKTAIDRLNLVTVLHELQQQDLPGKMSMPKALAPHLPASLHIADNDCRTLLLVDAIFNNFPKCSNLDPVILQEILNLRIVIAKLALLDESFLTSEEHFGQILLNDISVYSLGWFAGMGKLGERFLQDIHQAIEELRENFQADVSVVQTAQANLTRILKRENERIEKLSARNCDGEAGKLREQLAQADSIAFINRKLSGIELPEGAINFLQERWLMTLKLAHLRFGQDSDEWIDRKKLTEQLIDSLVPPINEGERVNKFIIISDICEKLAAALLPEELDTAASSLLESISESHGFTLRGQAPEGARPFQLDSPDTVNAPESIESIALLSQVLGFSEGQWLLYKDASGEWLRCRLARKIEGVNQLLFLNRQGQKIMAMGLGELAACIAKKDATPLDPIKIFSVTYPAVLKSLSRKYQNNRNSGGTIN